MANNILGTDVVVQIGFLVRDLQSTAQAYSDLLGQPFQIYQTDVQEKAGTKYMGLDTPARCWQAFFDIGPNLQLELIQPDEHPSIWRDDLEKHGEGVHHIAFKVKGTDQILRQLDARGMSATQTGGWATGRYAYVDSRDQLKTVVELLEDL